MIVLLWPATPVVTDVPARGADGSDAASRHSTDHPCTVQSEHERVQVSEPDVVRISNTKKKLGHGNKARVRTDLPAVAAQAKGLFTSTDARHIVQRHAYVNETGDPKERRAEVIKTASATIMSNWKAEGHVTATDFSLLKLATQVARNHYDNARARQRSVQKSTTTRVGKSENGTGKKYEGDRNIKAGTDGDGWE